MEQTEPCRFCEITTGRYGYIGIDEPFASNDNFIAIASIGALVEGWTLVVPKSHQFSMRKNYQDPAFADMLANVLPLIVKRYGPLIAFEHGANNKESLTSCGTSHAHLHLVPFEASLIPKLDSSGRQWLKCHASEIENITAGKEYLFYTELKTKRFWHDPIGYLHVLEQPVSQFFRRLIGEHVGNADKSDYKYFPHLDAARQTRVELISSTM